MLVLPGQRIELIAMVDDPDPVEPGSLGIVKSVAPHGSGPDKFLQIDVAWDNGRTVMLVVPPDQYRILEE